MPEDADHFARLNPGIWKAVSVAGLGSFLSQLDATVVNVSLGSLAAELHSSLQAIQWVTSGYLFALALMLPLNGWLVERLGTKRLYLICFSSFTLSSVLCALSRVTARRFFMVFDGYSPITCTRCTLLTN